jgi:hypothetical protein
LQADEKRPRTGRDDPQFTCKRPVSHQTSQPMKGRRTPFTVSAREAAA